MILRTYGLGIPTGNRDRLVARRYLLGILLAESFAAAAHAQELRPLTEYLALPKDRQNMSYLGARCAGLYQGIWAMEERAWQPTLRRLRKPPSRS